MQTAVVPGPAAAPAAARRSILELIAFGQFACQYRELRAQYPTARALTIANYIRDDHGLTFPQYECEQRGHSWGFTGTAYGGDDERYLGEGRAYCGLCLADGAA